MNDEILATLIEAITVYKEKISDLEDTLDLLKDETKANQSEVVKTKDILEKQIEDMAIATNKLIEKAIKSIEIPEAEKVDYFRIETSIKAKINRLINEKDTDIAEVRADLKRYVIENLARFKPKDGKSADNDLIIRELKEFIDKNKAEFRGKDGRDGKKGTDAVGIKDIEKDKDYLTIYLTDGTKKRFEIPKTTIYRGGGGSVSSGLDVKGLTELTDLLESDEVMIIRNNEPFKVKMSVLSDYFGSPIPPNAYVDSNGLAYTDNNGNYYTIN